MSSRDRRVPGVLPLIRGAKRDLVDEGTTGGLHAALVAPWPLALAKGIWMAAARAPAAARKARRCIIVPIAEAMESDLGDGSTARTHSIQSACRECFGVAVGLH